MYLLSRSVSIETPGMWEMLRLGRTFVVRKEEFLSREQILGQLRERILAFAASRIGRDAAEDLAQESLMVLEQRYPAIIDIAEMLPLAFQIMRFKMAAWSRKSIRRGEHTAERVEEVALRDGLPDPEQALEREELKQRLMSALALMGERCRRLFRLKLEGLSFEDIRVRMDARTINTVYTWDLRCRQDLKERLGLGVARGNA
jgi:RNA polymerase sigma-70 factor, ECF subfamily